MCGQLSQGPHLPAAITGITCTHLYNKPMNRTTQEQMPLRMAFPVAPPVTREASAGCDVVSDPVEGSVRLRGGFGTQCDPVHTGFIEIFHLGEWRAVCEQGQEDRLVADVVCRQLGYPHGTPVRPLSNRADPAGTDDGDYVPMPYEPITEEAEEPLGRFWLSRAACRGTEDELLDCNVRPGFRRDNAGCTDTPVRVTVACRSFPVPSALESVVTPGAGVTIPPCMFHDVHNVLRQNCVRLTAGQALLAPSR